MLPTRCCVSLFLLVWLLDQLHCKRLSEYQVANGLQGKQCRAEDTVFNRSLGDPLLCILMCFDRDGCLGVFFSKGAASCVGCRLFYSDGTGLGESDGDIMACFATTYGQTMPGVNPVHTSSDSFLDSTRVSPYHNGTHIYTSFGESEVDTASINDNFIGLTSINTGPLSISKLNSSTQRTASLEPSTKGTTNSDIFFTTTVTHEQGLSSTSRNNKDVAISVYFSNMSMTNFSNAVSSSRPHEESFAISMADSGITSISDVRYVSGTIGDLASSKVSSSKHATDFDHITNTSVKKENVLRSTSISVEILQTHITNTSEDMGASKLSDEVTVNNAQKPSLTSNYLNFSSYSTIFGTVAMTGSSALGKTRTLVEQSISTTSILPAPVKKEHYSESISRIEKTTNYFDSLFPKISLSRPAKTKSVTKPVDTLPTIYPSFYTYTPQTWEAGTGMRSLTGNDVSSKDHTKGSNTSTDVNDLNPSSEYPPVGQGYLPQFWNDYDTARYHSATCLQNFLDYCDYLAEYDDTFYRFLGCYLFSSRGT